MIQIDFKKINFLIKKKKEVFLNNKASKYNFNKITNINKNYI